MSDSNRIDSILGEWLESREQGVAADPTDVIEAHPDLAGELRRRFRVLSLLEDAESGRKGLRPLPEQRYGDFRVVGEGGMGIVYWALDTDLNRQVAFKIVRPRTGDGVCTPSLPIGLSPPAANTPASRAFETLKARFLQEAWVTAGLEHPGIVPVYELGETPEGVPYYTMRFVRGSRPLGDLISEVRGKPMDERLGLLDPFLKVCDTIRYAHAHDVVHRDLKPDNVAVGEFGEVVVLDWGLAKVRSHSDAAGETWRERLEEYRKAKDLRTIASAMGTPGYMSPEAALGRVAEVDERSDVYSLGAILFEILTDRLPVPFDSFLDLVRQLSRGEPTPPHEVDSGVPEELSRICTKALAPEKTDRFEHAGELAKAIRAWQCRTAADREADRLVREARSEHRTAARLSGPALLEQVDRISALARRIDEVRPGHPVAEQLDSSCTRLRQKAIEERERMARRRLARRGGAAVLFATAVFLAVFAVAISIERNAKAAALDEVLRLADAKKVRDLLAEVDELWPLTPETAPRMARWLERAREVVAHRDTAESALERLRARTLPYTGEDHRLDHAKEYERLEHLRGRLEEIHELVAMYDGDTSPSAAGIRASHQQRGRYVEKLISDVESRVEKRSRWSFASATDDWQHAVLSELVSGIRELADGDTPRIREIEARYAFCRDLVASSITDHREEWEHTLRALADETAHPLYRGLQIDPVPGLVPLGPDPASGLFEFGHLGSGRIPTRHPETGRLELDEDTGIVLVLLPGGTFLMGAQRKDPERPNYDPQAADRESPVHEVTLGPFFLSKYECTLGQWRRLTNLDHEGYARLGEICSTGKVITLRHPVDSLDFFDSLKWMERHRLTLPTEAQWEYACRAGTSTPWYTGKDAGDARRVANLAEQGEHPDGHHPHAPVGSFPPNPFGLHDMYGNLWEWCLDDILTYPDRALTEPMGLTVISGCRALRGGAFNSTTWSCRSAGRFGDGAVNASNIVGFRPAARLH